MKEIIIDILIVLCFYSLTSCKTKTVYVPVERVRTETVTVKDTITEIKLEHIRDSVSVPDSASYLSNKYAYSYARITGGILSHSLSTHPVSIPVEVKYIEKTITDSIPVPYEVKVYEYKDKPLSWWQSTRMRIGEASIISLIAIILYLGVRFFRKKII